MDANKDGLLTPDEIPEQRRAFISMILQRYGINPNQTINLNQLERLGQSGSTSNLTAATIASSGVFSPTRAANVSSAQSLVPPFGEPQQANTPVLGFGFPEPQQSQPNTPFAGGRDSGSSSASSQDAAREEQISKSANDLLSKHDKNRNGVLDLLNGEWSGLPFNAQTADKNKDGRLNRSEIIAALGGKTTTSLGSAKSGVRVATAQDRMPQGVPAWYLERDKDKDGQLTLLEYANDQPLTDAIAAEFEGLDKNNDGFITIAECYAYLKNFDENKRKKEEADRLEASKQPPKSASGQAKREEGAAPASAAQDASGGEKSDSGSTGGERKSRSGRNRSRSSKP